MARTATTTASFSLSSSDLTSDALNLSTSTTLRKAGSRLGLIDTSGLARKTTFSTSIYELFDGGSYTASRAHKVYLNNLSTIASEYLLITVNAEEIGRLYAGDWAFFPWSAVNATSDIKITPSVATSMTLEYMLIYE
jgi:hypothetical protein